LSCSERTPNRTFVLPAMRSVFLVLSVYCAVSFASSISSSCDKGEVDAASMLQARSHVRKHEHQEPDPEPNPASSLVHLQYGADVTAAQEVDAGIAKADEDLDEDKDEVEEGGGLAHLQYRPPRGGRRRRGEIGGDTGRRRRGQGRGRRRRSSPPQAEQFTPDQADWSSFESKIAALPSITGHDPNGVGWIQASAWEAARWDGVPYDPSQMSKFELESAICPGGGDTIRGIREVFYQHNPFADNTNPTKAEVDEWHRIAINHVRALVGYTQPERQVQKDHCMFARSLWAQQRQWTRQWDEEYPGQDDTAYGPCPGQDGAQLNAHCGASFIPSAEQGEFLPESHPTCPPCQGCTEGQFSGAKADIPWSIKWSRVICDLLGGEGFWGAHTGPFFHREKFGFSFVDENAGFSRSNVVMRGKWTGNLMPNLFEER